MSKGGEGSGWGWKWGWGGGETERQRGGGESARDQEAEAKPLAKTAERDTERAPNTRRHREGPKHTHRQVGPGEEGRGETGVSPALGGGGQLQPPQALDTTGPRSPGLTTVQTLPTSSLLPSQGRAGRGCSCCSVYPGRKGKIQPSLGHPWWSSICIWELGRYGLNWPGVQSRTSARESCCREEMLRRSWEAGCAGSSCPCTGHSTGPRGPRLHVRPQGPQSLGSGGREDNMPKPPAGGLCQPRRVPPGPSRLCSAAQRQRTLECPAQEDRTFPILPSRVCMRPSVCDPGSQDTPWAEQLRPLGA